MKNISIINACTDLGVNVNGSNLGPEILTKDLNAPSISKKYTIKKYNAKSNSPKKNENNLSTIDDFVESFNQLLLKMHSAHFENYMTDEDAMNYHKKMKNIVLAIKSLDSKNEKRNLNTINEFNKELYELILKILENDEFPITIGGDHIVAIASSLASIKKYQNLGIIWFDSHADFNTYKTSVTGNLHGLPLAVATHYEKNILADFHSAPFYNPKNSVIVGGRDIDPWEWSNILDAGVTVFSTKDIQTHGAKEICQRAFDIATAGTNGVHISFDLDLIDPNVAPGVSVPAVDGLNLKETQNLIFEISKYANIIKSADLVEFNPIFDKNHTTEDIAKFILNEWIKAFSNK